MSLQPNMAITDPSPIMTIDVLINAHPFTLAAHSTLEMAIEAYGIRPPFAAALNMNFVPKAHYASTRLQDADQIELITPITGG